MNRMQFTRLKSAGCRFATHPTTNKIALSLKYSTLVIGVRFCGVSPAACFPTYSSWPRTIYRHPLGEQTLPGFISGLFEIN